jgi:nitrogen-specific signal transduction histidine kinase
VVVEIHENEGATPHSVTKRGHLPDRDPEEIFRRGVTTHPEGQGLGLARSRMLAGINGGQLRLGPAEAGQTTFVLNLRSRPPAVVA